MINFVPDYDGLDINLLFFSAGGVDLCVDTDQIESTSAYSGEESDGLIRLNEELECPAAEIFSKQVIFKIKTGDGSSFRILADRMIDIVETESYNIHPLPPLVELFALKKGLWGVLPYEGRLVLVIDFLLLAREKKAAKEEYTKSI